ncbi:hypothetical protein DPMN_119555 [Dreissena polymorpha]|uniref:Uncharacterized protein n=1 Tax=Dreissena polymorpha TaxID=45954 RepID=A0A9D4JMV7_DREPO|nr:hypothetical protein DPMN_119555 [Dreissena polymorpha]
MFVDVHNIKRSYFHNTKQSNIPTRRITLSLNSELLDERELIWWEESQYTILNNTGQVVAPQKKSHSILQFNRPDKTVLSTLITKDDCVY